MNKVFPALIVVGAVLIAIAAVTAASISEGIQKDFDKYVRQQGGTVQHTQVSESVLGAIGNGRMLQNIWLGSTGLVLLAAGLLCIVRYPRSE